MFEKEVLRQEGFDASRSEQQGHSEEQVRKQDDCHFHDSPA
jgi:hypothetical protein